MKYNLDIHNDQNVVLSYLFASKILHAEISNNTREAVAYLMTHKTFAVTVNNSLFTLYAHFTQCMSDIYGGGSPLVTLNDAVFVRGIASFYEDIVRGNLPLLNQLPPDEAAAMQKIREYLEAESQRQQTELTQVIQENKNVVN